MFSKRIAMIVATAAATLVTAGAAPVTASALDIAAPARATTPDGCTWAGKNDLGFHYDCTFFGSKFHCIQGYPDAPPVVYCKKV